MPSVQCRRLAGMPCSSMNSRSRRAWRCPSRMKSSVIRGRSSSPWVAAKRQAARRRPPPSDCSPSWNVARERAMSRRSSGLRALAAPPAAPRGCSAGYSKWFSQTLRFVSMVMSAVEPTRESLGGDPAGGVAQLWRNRAGGQRNPRASRRVMLCGLQAFYGGGHMRRLGSLAAAVCALALVSSSVAGRSAMAHGATEAATGAATTPVGDGSQGKAAGAQPALWRTYDMIVNLQNLPRTYTCDELWYEFHGILLQLGAWSYSINILPYHCSPTPSGDMKSPDVQVRFQLPFFLQGPAVKYATAKAVEQTIRLSPGEPKTLHPADCELMQQITQTLLASLP